VRRLLFCGAAQVCGDLHTFPTVAGLDCSRMQSVLQVLQSLQEVDRDLYLVLEELKRLPAERAKRQAALDKLASRAAELKAEARKVRIEAKEHDDKATVARQRIKKLDTEAAASRADQAMLAAFDHEKRNLKREIGASEETGILLLEKAETLEKEAATLEAQHASELTVYNEFAANVEAETKAAEARKAKLVAARAERMGAGVPQDTLALYARVLTTRDGQALAQLEGRVCGACYMEVPTNMVVRVSRGAELVQCPSCDRILYH